MYERKKHMLRQASGHPVKTLVAYGAYDRSEMPAAGANSPCLCVPTRTEQSKHLWEAL